VAADRIDASIVSSIGHMKQVQVTWNGELRRFSESAPGFSRAGTKDQLRRAQTGAAISNADGPPSAS
jgi:hypothetical protein